MKKNHNYTFFLLVILTVILVGCSSKKNSPGGAEDLKPTSTNGSEVADKTSPTIINEPDGSSNPAENTPEDTIISPSVEPENGNNDGDNNNNNNNNNNDNNNNNNNNHNGNHNNNGNGSSIVPTKEASGSTITPTREASTGNILDNTPTKYPTTKPEATPVLTKTPVNVVTPVVTSTPRPTITPVPTLTPRPTMTPVATSTPRPTITPKPTSTPLPTATPTPWIVKYILEVDKTVKTQVSRKGTIVLYYCENDTAPDYPYITSHSRYTPEQIERIVAKTSMEDLFINMCFDLPESYHYDPAYVIGTEEITVDVDYVDLEGGYYGILGSDGWIHCYDIKDTKGCIYSDGRVVRY